VFSPCTGVDHIKAPKIIHLDKEWKEGDGKKVTSTAEHSLSLLLQLAKKNNMQLYGKRIAIIGGGGRIGSMMAEYCRTLKLEVDIIEDYYFFNECPFSVSYYDIFSIHIPLKGNIGFIDRDIISSMGKNALVINTSRQGVVDIDAIEEFGIAYADDFLDERVVKNAIQTPHIGGSTLEAREMTDIYIANRLKEECLKNDRNNS